MRRPCTIFQAVRYTCSEEEEENIMMTTTTMWYFEQSFFLASRINVLAIIRKRITTCWLLIFPRYSWAPRKDDLRRIIRRENLIKCIQKKKNNKKTNIYFSNVSKLSTIHQKQNQMWHYHDSWLQPELQ